MLWLAVHTVPWYKRWISDTEKPPENCGRNVEMSLEEGIYIRILGDPTWFLVRKNGESRGTLLGEI